jgi:phosphatidylinositol alpha-1,6-mannosyltransferase
LNNKKAALLITRNYPPLVGGMERLMFNLVEQLSDEYDISIVAPIGSRSHVIKKHPTYQCRLKPNPLFLFCATLKSIFACQKNRFAVCISGSGVTAPVSLVAGKLFNIPTACFIHGLDLVVENSIYQHIFLPAIRKADLIIANSKNTAQIAATKGIPAEKIRVINPGVHTDFTLCPQTGFRVSNQLENRKVLLYVGRIIRRKGLREFIEQCMPEIIVKHPNTTLVILGSAPVNALDKNNSLAKQVMESVCQHGLEEHVLHLGRVNDDILNAAYTESDLCIFPLIDVPGDVEGFGMVAVEAAARGTPTVAFSVGGVTDAIEPKKSGFLIEPGNYDEMVRQINDYLSEPDESLTSRSCTEFADLFSWSSFGKKIRSAISSLVNSGANA